MSINEYNGYNDEIIDYVETLINTNDRMISDDEIWKKNSESSIILNKLGELLSVDPDNKRLIVLYSEVFVSISVSMIPRDDLWRKYQEASILLVKLNTLLFADPNNKKLKGLVGRLKYYQEVIDKKEHDFDRLLEEQMGLLY